MWTTRCRPRCIAQCGREGGAAASCFRFQVTTKRFNFPKKHELPFFFVSAADGTNVVKVRARARAATTTRRPTHRVGRQVFSEAIRAAWLYKQGADDFLADVMQLLDEVRCWGRAPCSPRSWPWLRATAAQDGMGGEDAEDSAT